MSRAEEGEELRCRCGAMLARATAAGIELYCRRCKSTTVIPFKELVGREHVVRYVEGLARREGRRRR